MLNIDELKAKIKEVQAALVDELITQGYGRFAARREVLSGAYTTPEYDKLWKEFESVRNLPERDTRSDAEVRADTAEKLIADQLREDHYE